MSCKYRDLFGKPDEGIHKYRIFGLAAVDVILTIILIIAITQFFASKPYLKVFIVVVLLFITIHRLFCVNTALNVALFGKVA